MKLETNELTSKVKEKEHKISLMKSEILELNKKVEEYE